MMPTGQAATSRRMPNSALASPKHVADDLPDQDRRAADRHLRVQQPVEGIHCLASMSDEQPLDVLGDHVDLEVDGVADLVAARAR